MFLDCDHESQITRPTRLCEGHPMPNNMLRSRSISLLVAYALRLTKNAARQTLQFRSLRITGCLLQLRYECPASHENRNMRQSDSQQKVKPEKEKKARLMPSLQHQQVSAWPPDSSIAESVNHRMSFAFALQVTPPRKKLCTRCFV